jgi:PIN domain nuclease of toxin-antitoxin system
LNTALLLDTCALIWAANLPATPALRDLLNEAWATETSVWVSPITAWEIGNLAAMGRIGIARPVLPWFAETTEKAGAQVTSIDARILVASTELPPSIHRDPADRIIVATARHFGLRIVTRDRKILDYARKGHVMALEC